jgi:mRNA interferase HigB
MRVISQKRLKDYAGSNPAAKAPLFGWYKVIKESQFADFAELRQSFGQVDYVKPFYVFNIGSGHRLIAAIHFNRQMVFVRHILTHQEYDRGKWKK